MACILLIDDDGALLEALVLAFEDAGHVVHTARDGREGLLGVARTRPDAVVSDVNMPRLDGFAPCRQLRQGGDLVPLVLLTARDNETGEALGLDLGATAPPIWSWTTSSSSRRSEPSSPRHAPIS